MAHNDELLDLLANEKFQDAVLNNKNWNNVQFQKNRTFSFVKKEAERIINFFKPKKVQFNLLTESSWNNFTQKIKQDNVSLTGASLFIHKTVKKSFFRYAAIIGFVLVTSWIVLIKSFDQNPRSVYGTGFNEKREIKLADQTNIILNSNTTIEVFGEWQDEQNRIVNLINGEAFFRVDGKPNSAYPKFIVQTRRLSVEVLGTEFNVKCRRDITEISLIEGSITLKIDQKNSIEMKAGQKTSYSHAKNLIVKNDHNGIGSVAWLNGKIRFDKSTLEGVAIIIEDNYGLNVLVSEQIRYKQVSGELPNRDLKVLLKSIEMSLDVDATLNGTKLIIEERRK